MPPSPVPQCSCRKIVGGSITKACATLREAAPRLPDKEPMTLKEELDARRAQFMQTAGAERIAAYQRGVDELVAAGAPARAVGRGDAAPDFTLPNARGEAVTLSKLLARAPLRPVGGVGEVSAVRHSQGACGLARGSFRDNARREST